MSNIRLCSEDKITLDFAHLETSEGRLQQIYHLITTTNLFLAELDTQLKLFHKSLMSLLGWFSDLPDMLPSPVILAKTVLVLLEASLEVNKLKPRLEELSIANTTIINIQMSFT